MGCLASLAALMALSIPAAIARASIVGAYVLIALFTVAAVSGVAWNARRRGAAWPRAMVVRIVVVAVVYAGVVGVEYATR